MERFKQMRVSEKIIYIVVFAFFCLFALSLIIPILWILLNSFKTDTEFRASSSSLPERWIFNNYFEAFTLNVNGTNILGMLANSVILTLGSTVLNTFWLLVTSYTMAKFKFKLNATIYTIVLVVMCVPSIGGTTFQYTFYKTIGIYDTYFSVFMHASGFNSNFLLMYAVFKGVSSTYMEAAYMDGAKNFRIFWQIMVPQVLPTAGSLALLHALGTWNDYFTSYMWLPGHPTLAYGLYEIQANATTKNLYPQMFAFMILCTLPILVVFIFMQNTLMESVTTGGIKG